MNAGDILWRLLEKEEMEVRRKRCAAYGTDYAIKLN